jgi:hypothetical protein
VVEHDEVQDSERKMTVKNSALQSSISKGQKESHSRHVEHQNSEPARLDGRGEEEYRKTGPEQAALLLRVVSSLGQAEGGKGRETASEIDPCLYQCLENLFWKLNPIIALTFYVVLDAHLASVFDDIFFLELVLKIVLKLAGPII